MQNNIQTFSVKELFRESGKYLIPIYQRNYAWGDEEIAQLIQDIIDYTPHEEKEGQNYYLGTLIVFERKGKESTVFETIDGQQRLTTLSILVSVIKNEHNNEYTSWFDKLNLSFASRPNSSLTLDTIFEGGDFQDQMDYNEGIKTGYELVKKNLHLKLSENNLSIEQFSTYLFEKVKLLRVPVPSDTELNHYFEIMNNRGEQLEKHEVLKSQMLEILNQMEEGEKEKASECFHLIWEACSNMEKYVQYGFSPTERNDLFGEKEWNLFQKESFEQVCDVIGSGKVMLSRGNGKFPISEIISLNPVEKKKEEVDDSPDRFTSVVSYPNFLLHVLRIQTGENIPLDDKRLIKLFKERIKIEHNKIDFVKTFAFNLLKTRFLLDQYIIKREFLAGNDRWSLKKLKKYEKGKVSYINSFGEERDENDFNSDNRRVLILLAMFHVSTPTQVYKHWLNGALNYLFHEGYITSTGYIHYLESLAKAFVFYRFLAKVPADYYDIIYKNEADLLNNEDDLDLTKLTFKKIENNLVFNYLDYLLWSKHSKQNKLIAKFEYSFRSSVEHYYPQYPKGGYDQLEPPILNSFGNLCLISHSKNSTLSNYMPTAKKEHYKNNQMDSVKQHIMMETCDPEKWREEAILEHDKEMKALLLKQLLKNTDGVKNKALDWYNEFQKSNKVLLARTLMCFGDISCRDGSTSGMPKYHLFNWEYINNTDAYARYEEYINNYNPRSLEEIITDHLENNDELKNDIFRYSLVRWKAMLEYCDYGNYGRGQDINTICLLKWARKDKHNYCDFYPFFIAQVLKDRYKDLKNFYFDQDVCSIELNSNNGILHLEHDQNIYLNIWMDENDDTKYCLDSYGIHGNSTFIKNLKVRGWQWEDGYYIHADLPTLSKLKDNLGKHIEELENQIDQLIYSISGKPQINE